MKMNSKLKMMGHANDLPHIKGRKPPVTQVKKSRHTQVWKSQIKQKRIIKDLMEYCNDTEIPRSNNLAKAIEYTLKKFTLCEKAKMIHLNDIFHQDDLDIWSESPGIPWRNNGYKTKKDIKNDPDAIQKVRGFWHFIKVGQEKKLPDCCAFLRYKKDESNVRTVYTYPATVTFGEAVFALPLIEEYKKLPTHVRPLGYELKTLTSGKKCLPQKCGGEMYYVELHFYKFDKKIPAWLIETAFDILALQIDFIHYKNYGVADVRKMVHMYTVIVDYFINTKIRLPSGLRFKKCTGVANGSYFTELTSSVVNCILTTWMCYEQHGGSPVDPEYLGDKSLFSTPIHFSIRKANRLMSTIGMKLNINKSQRTKIS